MLTIILTIGIIALVLWLLGPLIKIALLGIIGLTAFKTIFDKLSKK